MRGGPTRVRQASRAIREEEGESHARANSEKMKVLKGVVAIGREAVRQGRDHGARRRGRAEPVATIRDRLARARPRARASAAIRAGASSRSTARSRAARPRSRSTRSREAQRAGGVCAFIDAEHALDVNYARAHRRRDRQAARVAARHRRAGARDRRDARALRRRRSRSSSTRSPRSCRRRRSRARWAIRTWACRRA